MAFLTPLTPSAEVFLHTKGGSCGLVQLFHPQLGALSIFIC